MIVKLAKVLGNVVSTVKHPTHHGLKLMTVQQVDCSGAACGRQLIAVDAACSGEGDYVVLADEGGASRMVIGDDEAAADAVIVGVLDGLGFGN